MGKEKTTVNQQFKSSEEQQAFATAQEEALNRQLAQTSQTQQAGLDLSQRLLRGQQLPGFLSGLGQGISPEVTQDISRQAIADIQPQLQGAGLLRSGVNAQLSGRIAGDIRNQAEQFNIQNRLNLLGLAFSGQLQAQSPILQQQGLLSGNLQGLRQFTGSQFGNQTQTTQSMNPFLKSFQQSLGSGLGSGAAAGFF